MINRKLRISPWIYPGIDLTTISLKDPLLLNNISQRVANYYKLSIDDLQGKSRAGNIMKARRMAMYFLCVRTRLRLTVIGGYFNRHHTTVLYNQETVKDLAFTNKGYAQKLKDVEMFLDN